MSQESIWYPPVSFYFSIDIGGKIIGSFREISGIEAMIKLEELEEPQGEKRFRLPKAGIGQNLIFKRGSIEDNKAFRNWIAIVTGAQLDRKVQTYPVEVKLCDEKGTAIKTWSFQNAWPVGIKLSDLKPDEKMVVVEAIELAYTDHT